jgi:hypothetical protein
MSDGRFWDLIDLLRPVNGTVIDWAMRNGSGSSSPSPFCIENPREIVLGTRYPSFPRGMLSPWTTYHIVSRV